MQDGGSLPKFPTREILVLHTSDVHVNNHADSIFSSDGLKHLELVVQTARVLAVDILLLVGDTFDHNRLPGHILEQAAALLAEAPGEIVALPGNHDPAMENCAFRHSAFAGLEHLHVLGVNRDDSVYFDALGMEIWGRPHRDFADMAPLHKPPPRTSRLRIAMAHGHYETRPDRTKWPRAAWLFGDAELAACNADYIALGHWNRRAPVGNGAAPAWYCGSPDLVGSVNLCRFGALGLVLTQEPLVHPDRVADSRSADAFVAGKRSPE